MRTWSVMFLLGVLLCGCAALTLRSQVPDSPPIMPDPRTLAAEPVLNTIPVAPKVHGIYVLPGTGLNHISLVFPGGTLLDPQGKEGAVQLLCSLMTSGGTQKYSPHQMQDVLGDLAVSISISPQREYTSVHMSFLPDVTEQAVQLLYDVLTAPRLDPKRFALEQKIYIDSVIRDKEDATTVAFDTFRAHYYHGDARAFTPTPQSIHLITREDLKRLHKALFHKKPLVGVVGELDEQYTKKLQDAFDEEWTFAPVGYPQKTQFGSYAQRAIKKQCVFLKAHAAPTQASADYAASVVADHIIGSGGFGSLMLKEIRTRKGLAYATRSFYQASMHWGVFGMYVITEPKDLAEVKSALERVMAAIKLDINEKDVLMAKQAVINSYAVGYNNPMRIVSHSMNMDFYGIPKEFDAKFLAHVNALTVEEVRDAATRLISGPWVEVVVNPPDIK